MKVNLEFIDGTILKDIMLSTTNTVDYRLGELHTEEELEDYFKGHTHKAMYFSGKYVQGGISSPKVIKSHEIINEDTGGVTVICNSCGKIYNYVPNKCINCGNVIVEKY